MQHRANCSDVPQCFRGLDKALIIFREAAVEAEPCEGTLNNPGETGNLERSLFALDDLRVPPVAQQLPSRLATFVSRVSNDGTNGRPEWREPGQQPSASPAVRHVGRFDPVGDRKAEYVDQDGPLPPFHSLVPVESANMDLYQCSLEHTCDRRGFSQVKPGKARLNTAVL